MLSKQIRSVLVISLFLFFPTQALAGTETLKVIMPWDGNGTLHSIGEDKMLFMGEMQGIMYVEKAKGEWDSAFASCPVKQIISTKTGESSATGYCEITVDPDKTAYAEITCKGKVGHCTGTITITGGTGKLKGISGSGDFTVRSVLGALAKGMGDGSVIRAGSGLAFMNKLTINTP
jgi:hypothetical protein